MRALASASFSGQFRGIVVANRFFVDTTRACFVGQADEIEGTLTEGRFGCEDNFHFGFLKQSITYFTTEGTEEHRILASRRDLRRISVDTKTQFSSNAHHLVSARRGTANSQNGIAFFKEPNRDRVKDFVERPIADAF